MITREADYAMRVGLFLAKNRRADRVTASCAEVAAAMAIPYRFLRKIVKRMVAAGLISSTRGKGGGLRLTRAPQQVTLLALIGAMGPAGVTLSRCVAHPRGCSRSAHCRARRALGRVQHILDTELAKLTLKDLI